MIGSRATTATLFAAALLAFLLPFGTVSCSEPPITFTGFELATATVQGDDADLVGEIESNGTLFAAVAGIAALVGSVLALEGRRGQGWAATAGLGALILLLWVGWLLWAELTARLGCVLAAGSLAGVVGVRSRIVLQARRVAGRRIWPVVTGLGLLALFLAITAVLLLEASRQALPAG